MEEEIAEGMNDLIAQRIRNRELPAIDEGAGLGGHNGLYVARVATETMEYLLAFYRSGRCAQGCVAWRGLCTAKELRKVVDVGETKGVGLVLWIGRRLSDARHIVQPQRVGDTHLVHIGIGHKGKKAAMLVLPAETTDPSLAGSLEDRNLDHFTVNPSMAVLRLVGSDRHQSLIVNGLHEAIPQRAECCSQLAQVFRGGCMFLGLGHRGAVIDDGAAADGRRPVVDGDGRIDERTR